MLRNIDKLREIPWIKDAIAGKATKLKVKSFIENLRLFLPGEDFRSEFGFEKVDYTGEEYLQIYREIAEFGSLKRIVVIPGLGYAHVTRSLEVANAIKYHFDVVIVLSPSFKSVADSLGLKYFLFEHKGIDYQKVAKGNTDIFTAEELASMAKDYMEILNKYHPHLVLTSAAIAAHISIRKKRIPHVALVDVSTTPYTTFKMEISFEYFLKGIMSKLQFPEDAKKAILLSIPRDIREDSVVNVDALINSLARVHGSVSHAKISDDIKKRLISAIPSPYAGKKMSIDDLSRAVLIPFNEAASAFKVKHATCTFDLIKADLNLMPDLPLLFPAQSLPSDCRYIGPLSWGGETEKVDSDIHIDPSQPLVYISMGSSGVQEHLETLASELSKSNYQAIMTTGGVADYKALRKYERKGFYIRSFLPGSKVIKMSQRTVVICHGGLGTVYQALQNGCCDIIVVPAHPQHELVGRRLRDLGLGIMLGLEDMGKISEIIHQMLNRFRPQAYYEILSELHTFPGPQKASQEIREYMQRIYR